MSLKGRLRGLERAARERLSWIDLPGGESYFYDPERTYATLFLHAANSYRVVREGQPLPDPPTILKVVGSLPTRAEREAAFTEVYGGASSPFVAFDVVRFLNTGEVVADSRIRRKPPGEDTPDQGEGDVRIGKPPDHIR